MLSITVLEHFLVVLHNFQLPPSCHAELEKEKLSSEDAEGGGAATATTGGGNCGGGGGGVSASLTPAIWEKTIPYDGETFHLEYMDLDEFLLENGIPVTLEEEELQKSLPSVAESKGKLVPKVPTTATTTTTATLLPPAPTAAAAVVVSASEPSSSSGSAPSVKSEEPEEAVTVTTLQPAKLDDDDEDEEDEEEVEEEEEGQEEEVAVEAPKANVPLRGKRTGKNQNIISFHF